jgi:CcmD family protein
MDLLGYLFAAYAIIFLAIFLYVLFIWRRQARLQGELNALEARMRDLREDLDAQVPRSRSAS